MKQSQKYRSQPLRIKVHRWVTCNLKRFFGQTVWMIRWIITERCKQDERIVQLIRKQQPKRSRGIKEIEAMLLDTAGYERNIGAWEYWRTVMRAGREATDCEINYAYSIEEMKVYLDSC